MKVKYELCKIYICFVLHLLHESTKTCSRFCITDFKDIFYFATRYKYYYLPCVVPLHLFTGICIYLTLLRRKRKKGSMQILLLFIQLNLNSFE